MKISKTHHRTKTGEYEAVLVKNKVRGNMLK